MADQYRPGDVVPHTGTVECKQYKGTRKSVTVGTHFPPCDNWGDHHGAKCTWEYVR